MKNNKYQTVLTKFIEDGHRLTHRERHEFGAILQELVDKETPIKPIRKGKLNWWHCPKCDCSLMFDNHKYCDHCSQKLLWGDECE